MNGTLRELAGEGLLQNAMALWGVQFFRKALPLITIPYLARVLGPDGWGLVVIFQSLAACTALLIEFGFELSATRQVARCRQDLDHLASVVAGVFGSQAVLAAGTVAVALLVRNWVPILRNHPTLVAFSLLVAVAEGLNPTWYFIGMERMGVVAALEITCKSAAAMAIFFLVRSPEDAKTVLALQAAAALLSILAALSLVYRKIPFRLPSRQLVHAALRNGWPMFLLRSSESFYTLGNAFILGFFVGPTAVGYFAGPEKITRALAGLFNPIRQSLYPRLSRLMQTSPAQGARLARVGMSITGLGGLAMGLGVFLLAPWLVRIVFGSQFAPAVAVLRLLSILPPLVSVAQSIGMQWLLPLGKERVVTRTVMMAGVLHVLLVLLLVPKLAHVGMAAVVICSETFVCATLLYLAMADSHHRLPFRGNAAFPDAGLPGAREAVAPGCTRD
jgi:PST family polysaccharide transporter